MVDRPANQAPSETSTVFAFYARKNNTTNDFIQIPEDEVAHAVGLGAGDVGKMFYVNASGKIAEVAAGGNEDVLGWMNSVPTPVAGAAAGLELTKSFTATGGITLANFVSLRSDGNVEAVTGTETIAAIGSDTTVTTVTSMRFIHAAWNATASKVVAIFYDLGASNTLYAVIGTLSGSTLTWGTPQTFTGGTGATFWTRGQAIWNAAGDKVIIAFEGATGYQSFVCASVSGTVMTFGSVVQNGTVAFSATSEYENMFFGHDNTHGTRFVFFDGGTASNILAGTYSGTTVTLGTSATFSMTINSRQHLFYDAANARFSAVASDGSTTYVKAATVSTTTWTVGSEVNSTALFLTNAAMETTSGKLVLFGIASASGNYGQIYAAVVTFSGAVSTINTAVLVANFKMEASQSNSPPTLQPTFEPTSGKCLFLARLSDENTSFDNQGDIVLFIGTVSGTTVTFTDPAALRSSNVIPKQMFARGSNGEVAVVYSDASDYTRWHVLTGQITAGAWVEKGDTRMRSVPISAPSPTAAGTTGLDLLCGWTVVDFIRWGTTGATSGFMAFPVVLPTESTNADDWIGAARATVTTGNSVSVRLRGGLVEGLSGLTSKTDYYLKGDGTLTATDNGRYAGRALSSTVLLTESL